MTDLAHVTAVEWLGGYRLRLTFRDGTTGDIDMEPEIAGFSGVLSKLAEVDFFRQVAVDPDWGTVTWPGDIELDSDVVYSHITGSPLPGQQPV